MRNSDWEHALENSALAEREKRQHRVIIRWFSAYCRKQHPPVPPGRELANEFDRNVLRERKREDWQLAQWRAGLRWFLEYLGERPRSLTAPPDREPHGEAAGGKAPQAGAAHAPALETGAPISGEPAEEQDQPPEPPSGNQAWRLTMIGQLRLKHLSYRTEQTYLEWVSRFAGFLKGRNPLTATDEDVVDFLSDLAVRKQVAGSTQNQALNLVEG